MAQALLCYGRIVDTIQDILQEDPMHIQTSLRRALVGSALCALALASPFSRADVTAPLTNLGFANGSEGFTISSGTNPTLPPEGVLAGGFVGLFGVTPITFWCAQINQFFPPDGQEYVASAFGNTKLAELFSEVSAGSRTDTAEDSAAFQIAVWEILFEGGSTLDVTMGNFIAQGDPATQAKANGYLANLPTSSTVQLVLLHNDSYQDFITDVVPPGVTPLIPVPEPASLALVGIGLFAVVFATRRRARSTSV